MRGGVIALATSERRSGVRRCLAIVGLLLMCTLMAGAVSAADTTITTITNLSDLQNLSAQVNAGNNYSGKTVTLNNSIEIPVETNWYAIGNATGTRFEGTFNGGNHTITFNNTTTDYDLRYNSLFGYAYNATFKDLKIVANTEGLSAPFANEVNATTFSNIQVSGSVTSPRQVGSLVRVAYDSIFTACTSSANLTIVPIARTDNHSGIGGGLVAQVCSATKVWPSSPDPYGAVFTKCNFTGNIEMQFNNALNKPTYLWIGSLIGGTSYESNGPHYAVKFVDCDLPTRGFITVNGTISNCTDWSYFNTTATDQVTLSGSDKKTMLETVKLGRIHKDVAVFYTDTNGTKTSHGKYRDANVDYSDVGALVWDTIAVSNGSKGVYAGALNLTDAFAIAKNGDTVKIVAETPVNSSLVITTDNITFDGGNQLIVLNTSVGSTAILTTNKSLTLQNLHITAALGANFGTAINLSENGVLKDSKIDLTNLNSEHATAGNSMSSIAVMLSGKDAVVKGNTITAGNSKNSSSQCIVVGANATISDNILTTGTSKADPKSGGKTSSGSIAIRLSAENVVAEITNNTITSNKESSNSTRNVAFAVDGSSVGGTVVNASNNTITLASHPLNGSVGGYGVVLYLNTGTSAEVVTNMHSNSVTGSTYVIYADNSSDGTSTTVKGTIFNNKFNITQNAVANHSTVTLTSSDLTWNTTPTDIGTYKKIAPGQTNLAGNWWGTWSEGKKSTTGYLTFTDVTAAKAAGLPVADLAPLVAVGQSASTIEVTGNFSIENKTGNSGTLVAQFTGGVAADFRWTTISADIITLSATSGSSVTYQPLNVGTTTVTVSSGTVTKNITITVYDEVKAPALPVSGVTKDETTGNTTISNTSPVVISDKIATIEDTINNVVMVVIFEGTPTVGSDNITGNVSSANVTYPEKIAALSPDVANGATEIKTSYGLVINLKNVTNQLPTIDPKFNTSIIEAIKAGNADAQSGKYTFISMITATENVTEINNNVTSGGVAVTFIIPLDWAKQITGDQLGKLKAFHLKSDRTATPLTGTGIANATNNTYTFTVKGDSFSSYVLGAYTYVAPPTQVPTSGSSSGSGNTDGALRVLFVTDGGSSGSIVAGLSSGDKVKQPATPVRNGYTFGGWYTDAACTKPWSFSSSINGDMTLYAKWTSNGSGTVETYPATANPTQPATATQTPSPSGGANPTGTAAATTAQSGGVSPTMTKAPAPVFGILAGLLAAGVLLRRRA